MKLLLMALGGCTAIDLIAILRKQRQDVHDIRIRIEGQRLKDHPRRFDAVHATFEVIGKGLDPKKVQTAVDLSIGRYCGVQASLVESVPVTWGSEVVEAK
ncbi:hypothetical protein HDU96_010786 [Phlyctochytrium bullatum]|nr:hypothetical protein HDU96_010786 [Phlyctochytrium bullatum]